MDHEQEFIKHREIVFCPLHPDRQQAHTAMLMFDDIMGVHRMQLINDHKIRVSYDVRHITLECLEGVLSDLGYHLDNSLLQKLKRSLYYYTEEVQRENLGARKTKNFTRQIFIEHYTRKPHGCQDERPHHWRRYL